MDRVSRSLPVVGFAQFAVDIAMNLADVMDGGNLLAMEIAGIVVLFLACVCVTGVLLLAAYFFAKAVQALVRHAVRRLRAQAFTPPVRKLYPATLGASYQRPAFHVTEE